LLSAGLSAKSVISVYALRNIELRVAMNSFIFHASGEMKSNDNCKLLIKKNHSTYQTEVFGSGDFGCIFFNKIVPPMEPSNWCRVYSSPTKRAISAHFTRDNCLLVGHLKQYFF
jgi:hypothetical protein